MQKGTPVGIYVGFQSRVIREAMHGEMRHQKSPELLFDQFRHDPGAAQPRFEMGLRLSRWRGSTPGSIDLLATDAMMPRMSGIALRRAFAEFRPATPVLFVSGEPAANTLAGEHFLPEPFTPGQLTYTVAALLVRGVRRRVTAMGLRLTTIVYECADPGFSGTIGDRI